MPARTVCPPYPRRPVTHYTADQLARFPWIASVDTLKTEDLLVKFWSVAEDLAARSNRPYLLNADTVTSLQRLVGEDSSADDWDDDDAARTLEDLTEALNDAAPVGFHFGSQDGDGACFGFWLSEDWAEALEHCGIAGDSDPEAVAAIVAELDALGVTSANTEDLFQGEASGYTEAEAGADYAQQFAEDIGAWDGKATWPHSCIDWADAWGELQADGWSLVRWSHARWLVFRFC
jgi:hypothetical protein